MSKGDVVGITLMAVLILVLLSLLVCVVTDNSTCHRMLDRAHDASDTAVVYRLNTWCNPHA